MREQSPVTKCRSCKAVITWISTRKNKKMPVNGAVKETLFDQELHTSHWDTCPQAEQWRGKAKAEPQKEPVKHVVPAAMQERLIRVRTEARVLLKKGVTVEELREVSREVTGLTRFENLHCTSQQILDRLIQRLEGLRP